MIETSKLITDLGYLFGKGIRPYPNPYKLETCNHYAVSLKDITIISDGITMTFEKNKVYNMPILIHALIALVSLIINTYGKLNLTQINLLRFHKQKATAPSSCISIIAD